MVCSLPRNPDAAINRFAEFCDPILTVLMPMHVTVTIDCNIIRQSSSLPAAVGSVLPVLVAEKVLSFVPLYDFVSH